MLFNSIEFAVFFPLVCLLYFGVALRWQTPLLLLASCVFYMAFVPAYILILGTTILVDYFAGIYIERTTGRRRHSILVLSIVVTCLILFVFKYFAFGTGAFVSIASLLGWKLSAPTIEILLPIGLSFHTFQSLSYVVEVYRGHQAAERNFVKYATFVMFFPQLVAGPIERPQNLLHQFGVLHRFDYDLATSGLRRMAWGFFKKLVIADRLALYVNDVYGHPAQHTGLQLTLATVFFAYQIYCDFSGYSDIAIGTARVLGFKLMENFDAPYHSATISEFWRRWHISLSTWFRDYVYYPLGGNRVGPLLRMRNLMLTFAISGLWHGAAWTYVIWGLLNGFYLVMGTVVHPWRKKALALAGLSEASTGVRLAMIAGTFALTCLGWIVFRAKTLDDAWYIFSHLTTGWDFSRIGTEQFLTRQLPIAFFAVVGLEIGQHLRRRNQVTAKWRQLPGFVRWLGYLAFVLLVLFFGVYRQTQFIYFQF